MNNYGIVSVRLTEAERASLGDRPSQGLREIIRRHMANTVPSPVAATTGTPSPRYAVIWVDGTFGAQWPAALTT